MPSLYRGAFTTLDPLSMHWLLEGSDGPVMGDMLDRAERIKHYAASRVRPSRVRGGVGRFDDAGKSLRDVGEAFIGEAPIGDRSRAGIAAGASTSITGGVVGIVRFPKKYATWYDQGTKPHVIRAKNAPTLVFYWAKVNAVVAFKQVNHPGTKPTHFLSDALVAGSG